MGDGYKLPKMNNIHILNGSATILAQLTLECLRDGVAWLESNQESG